VCLWQINKNNKKEKQSRTYSGRRLIGWVMSHELLLCAHVNTPHRSAKFVHVHQAFIVDDAEAHDAILLHSLGLAL